MDVCPKCSGTTIFSVEYYYTMSEHYDGVSEYRCNTCNYRQGRWTGKQLPEGYVEPRFGKGGEPVLSLPAEDEDES